MAIPATQMRPGHGDQAQQRACSVFSVEHRTPGNLRAFIQAKLRNLRTGAMFEHRFRSGDAIEKITVDEVKMEFLYAGRRALHFHEHGELRAALPGQRRTGRRRGLPDPEPADHGGVFRRKAVGIELPQTVELTVVETEPGLKSATASSVTKPAKTETGLVVQVPPFINEGEKIRVDTSEGAYLSRA